MKSAMRGYAFLIYTILSLNVEPRPHEMPSKYQKFKDVFEKKNVGTLLKHQPYDCTINIVEGP